MIKGIYNFISQHVTITVFVSVIVYKIFSILLDNLITPLLFMIIDRNDELPNMKLTYGQHSCYYGTTFRTLVSSFLSLIIIYLVT